MGPCLWCWRPGGLVGWGYCVGCSRPSCTARPALEPHGLPCSILEASPLQPLKGSFPPYL